ncbi:uncharacterized protein TNCV_4933121 [Trichonephila clavipes]|nr:uncharacterized protein TNCV_4933121 [Trichonephila clavipes]
MTTYSMESNRCSGYRSPLYGYWYSRPTTRGLLVTDLVILNHGQETRTTPEVPPRLLTITLHQREDVSAPDRLSVHRSPIRRFFSGPGLELMTCSSHDPIPRPLGYRSYLTASDRGL